MRTPKARARLKELARRIRLWPLSDLSAKSGVPASTLRSLREGFVKNPGIVTVEEIENGLDKMEGKA
jgi:hypothetical protein